MHTWRAVLAGLATNTRRRLVLSLDVNERTFRRWIDGQTTPHDATFRRLLMTLPLVERAQMFYALRDDEVMQHYTDECEEALTIPPAFRENVIQAATTSPPELRFPTATQLALIQMRGLLDSMQQGVCIILFCCFPSSDKQVRSLLLRCGIGSRPWLSTIWSERRFVGCESFIGRSVMEQKSLYIPDMRCTLFTSPPINGALSMATGIIRRGTAIAGGIMVASTQLDSFSASHRSYLDQYCDLLGCVFHANEWYAPEQIALLAYPPFHEQDHVAHYRQRMTECLQQMPFASRQQREWEVLHQMEQDLLRLPCYD